MGLPVQYSWLVQSLARNAGKPLMVAEALRFYGVQEIAGPANNAIIMAWAKEISDIPGKVVKYTSDDRTAWCGLFMAHVAHVVGEPFPDKPLWALNWTHFGNVSPQAALGDVLVFNRTDSKGHRLGHVGLYVGEDGDHFHVLGGNESNQVEIERIPKPHLARAGARRPLYRSTAPANVSANRLANDGALSTERVSG